MKNKIPVKYSRFFRKTTAIFLLISLNVSQSFGYAQSNSEALLVKRETPALIKDKTTVLDYKITIPPEFGHIEEFYDASQDTFHASRSFNQTVVYVQDAHDSLEAQENIAKIIGHLVEKEGVKTVFEEGYEGPVPTDEYFGWMKDPVIKEKVSYFLMDKLRIGGAEYAHINRPHPTPLPGGEGGVRGNFKLIGADNIKLHLENIAWYRKNARHKEITEKDLTVLQNEIDKLANQHFSKELKDWIKQKQLFEEGKLGLLDYLKQFMSLRGRLPNKTEARLVGRRAIATATPYPTIHLLLTVENAQDKDILKKAKALDSKILFQEMAALENDFFESVIANSVNHPRNDVIRKIFKYHKELALLKRLNRIEITAAEYETVKEPLRKFNTLRLAQFIVSQTGRSLVLSRRWEANLKHAIRFYELAHARDRAIGKSLEKFMGNDSENLSALVFGGFHKESILDLLRKKGISYYVISPKITQIESRHQELYARLMTKGYSLMPVSGSVAQAARPVSEMELAAIGGESAKSQLRNYHEALNEAVRALMSKPEFINAPADYRSRLIEEKLASGRNPDVLPASPAGGRSELRAGADAVEMHSDKVYVRELEVENVDWSVLNSDALISVLTPFLQAIEKRFDRTQSSLFREIPLSMTEGFFAMLIPAMFQLGLLGHLAWVIVSFILHQGLRSSVLDRIMEKDDWRLLQKRLASKNELSANQAKAELVKILWRYMEKDKDPRVRAAAYMTLTEIGIQGPIKELNYQLQDVEKDLIPFWIRPELALDAELHGGRPGTPAVPVSTFAVLYESKSDVRSGRNPVIPALRAKPDVSRSELRSQSDDQLEKTIFERIRTKNSENIDFENLDQALRILTKLYALNPSWEFSMNYAYPKSIGGNDVQVLYPISNIDSDTGSEYIWDWIPMSVIQKIYSNVENQEGVHLSILESKDLEQNQNYLIETNYIETADELTEDLQRDNPILDAAITGRLKARVRYALQVNPVVGKNHQPHFRFIQYYDTDTTPLRSELRGQAEEGRQYREELTARILKPDQNLQFGVIKGDAADYLEAFEEALMKAPGITKGGRIFFDSRHLLKANEFKDNARASDITLSNGKILTVFDFPQTADKDRGIQLYKIKSDPILPEDFLGYSLYSLRPWNAPQDGYYITTGFHLFKQFRENPEWRSSEIFEANLKLLYKRFQVFQPKHFVMDSNSQIRNTKVGNAATNTIFYLKRGFYPPDAEGLADELLGRLIQPGPRLNAGEIYGLLQQTSWKYWILPLVTEPESIKPLLQDETRDQRLQTIELEEKPRVLGHDSGRSELRSRDITLDQSRYFVDRQTKILDVIRKDIETLNRQFPEEKRQDLSDVSNALDLASSALRANDSAAYLYQISMLKNYFSVFLEAGIKLQSWMLLRDFQEPDIIGSDTPARSEKDQSAFRKREKTGKIISKATQAVETLFAEIQAAPQSEDRQLKAWNDFMPALDKIFEEMLQQLPNHSDRVEALKQLDHIWKYRKWEPVLGRVLQHFILLYKRYLPPQQYEETQRQVFTIVSQFPSLEERLQAWWLYLTASVYHLRNFGVHVEKMGKNDFRALDNEIILDLLKNYFLPDLLKWKKENGNKLETQDSKAREFLDSMLWVLGLSLDLRIYDVKNTNYKRGELAVNQDGVFPYEAAFPNGNKDALPHFFRPLAAAYQEVLPSLIQEILDLKDKHEKENNSQYVYDGQTPSLKLLLPQILMKAASQRRGLEPITGLSRIELGEMDDPLFKIRPAALDQNTLDPYEILRQIYPAPDKPRPLYDFLAREMESHRLNPTLAKKKIHHILSPVLEGDILTRPLSSPEVVNKRVQIQRFLKAVGWYSDDPRITSRALISSELDFYPGQILEVLFKKSSVTYELHTAAVLGKDPQNQDQVHILFYTSSDPEGISIQTFKISDLFQNSVPGYKFRLIVSPQTNPQRFSRSELRSKDNPPGKSLMTLKNRADHGWEVVEFFSRFEELLQQGVLVEDHTGNLPFELRTAYGKLAYLTLPEKPEALIAYWGIELEEDSDFPEDEYPVTLEMDAQTKKVDALRILIDKTKQEFLRLEIQKSETSPESLRIELIRSEIRPESHDSGTPREFQNPIVLGREDSSKLDVLNSAGSSELRKNPEEFEVVKETLLKEARALMQRPRLSQKDLFPLTKLYQNALSGGPLVNQAYLEEDLKSGGWAVKLGDQTIGQVDLNFVLRDGKAAIKIGREIFSQYQGQGYGTAFTELVLSVTPPEMVLIQEVTNESTLQLLTNALPLDEQAKIRQTLKAWKQRNRLMGDELYRLAWSQELAKIYNNNPSFIPSENSELLIASPSGRHAKDGKYAIRLVLSSMVEFYTSHLGRSETRSALDNNAFRWAWKNLKKALYAFALGAGLSLTVHLPAFSQEPPVPAPSVVESKKIDEKIKQLMVTIQDKKQIKDVRESAVKAELEKIQNPSAVPTLISGLKNAERGGWIVFEDWVFVGRDFKLVTIRHNVYADALAGIGKPAVPALIELLADQDIDVRKAALYALGKIKDISAVPELIKKLKDEMSTDIINTLGEIGDPSAVGALIEILENEHFPRDYKPTMESQKREVKEYNRRLKVSAINALGEIKDPSAVPALISALAQYGEAVRALEQINEPRAQFYFLLYNKKIEEAYQIENSLSFAREAVGHKNENVRESAKQLLVEKGQLGLIEHLKYYWGGYPILTALFLGVLFFSTYGLLEFLVIKATLQLGAKRVPGVQWLLRWILLGRLFLTHTQGGYYRHRAAKELEGYGSNAGGKTILAFVKILQNKDFQIRSLATEALIKMKRSEAVPALIEILSDTNEALNEVAAKVLREIATPEALFYYYLHTGDTRQALQINEKLSFAVKALNHRRSIKIRIKGAEMLGLIKDVSAAPHLIPLLNNKEHSLRPVVSKSLMEIGPLKDEKLLPPLFKLIGDPDSKVVHQALEIIHSILSAQTQSVLPEEHWKRIINRNQAGTILYIYEKYPEMVNRQVQWLGAVTRLVKNVNQVSSHINNAFQRSAFQKDVLVSIDKYISAVVPKKNAEAIAQEYGEISSWISIVHRNIPFVLNALRNMRKSAAEFHQLRQVLDHNNPLTSIIRLLGENRADGGYLDVTERIIKAKQFKSFYQEIIKSAKNKKDEAPQEIEGLLQVLRDSIDFWRWKEKDWSELMAQIDRYYAHGFKSISGAFFDYFRKHENDPAALAEMRDDINYEFMNLAWGGFTGFSDKLYRKYEAKFTDEMTLLLRYMSLNDFTKGYYAAEYGKVKAALLQRGQLWTEEVDSSLRTLFRYGALNSIVIYQPKENERIDRESLHHKLKTYGRGKSSSQAVRKALDHYLLDNSGTEDLKSALVDFTFLKNNQLERNDYGDIPLDEVKIQRWLFKWQTFIIDAFEINAWPDVAAAVKEAIDSMSDKDLQKALSENNIPEPSLIRLNDKKFKEDDEMIAAIASKKSSLKEKQDQLSEIFLKKWLILVKVEDIKNDTLFRDWVNKGADSFSKKLLAKAKKKNPSLPITELQAQELIKNALLDASKQIDGEVKKRIDLNRKKGALADIISRKIKSIFDKEKSDIDTELKGFISVATSHADTLYVGFFDDLLHLMGFMLSGVCTWDERHDQVLNTGYHFGKLAIKDSFGKILAVSQVQLLKADIKTLPISSSSKGWKVIALPGINTHRTTKESVLALLEAAQRLAEMAGMEGAVIPVEAGIHSNQGSVHTVINELASKGWLKQAELTQAVPLTPTRYSYQNVYLVNIPKEQFVLELASLEEVLEPEKKITFGGGLGEVTYQGVHHEKGAYELAEKINEILANIPKPVMENIRLNASMKDAEFKILIDLQRDKSRVNKTEHEIELQVGKDVLYAPGKIELITLTEMVAELLTAFILENYNELKQQAKSNENAYFKIENIKGLLTYKSYLAKYHKIVHKNNWNPSQFLAGKNAADKENLFTGYRSNLDQFTAEMGRVKQWNLFLNILDDGDPDFMGVNYLHLLSMKGLVDNEDEIGDLILELVKVDVFKQPSLSALRDLVTNFILNGKARIKIGDKIEQKESFNHFSQSQQMMEWKDVLLVSQDQNQFYGALKNLLEVSSLFQQKEISGEISRLIDKNIFGRADRENALREIWQEILVRKIGSHAFNILKAHLTGRRGSENIPYIKSNVLDLEEGTDADSYGFLEYTKGDGIDYNLVFKGADDEGPEETEPEPEAPYDWVSELFPFPSEGQPPAGETPARSEVRSVSAKETVIFVDGAANDRDFKARAEELAVLAASDPKRRVVVYNADYEIEENQTSVAELLKSFRLANIKFVPGTLTEVLKPYQFRQGMELVHYSSLEEDAILNETSSPHWSSDRLTHLVGEPGALGYGLKYLQAIRLNKAVEDIQSKNGYYLVSPKASALTRLLQEAQFVTVFAQSA